MKHLTALALIATACVGPAAIGAVRAHHAMVMYDRLRTVTLDGTVVELQWTNPHVFLLVRGKVADDEEADVWRLETSAPSRLAQLGGWSATSLKYGDRVRVDVNPLRDGKEKAARIAKVTVIDSGAVLGTQYLDLDLRRQQ
jgi:uncharacterized protein DUF6152